MLILFEKLLPVLLVLLVGAVIRKKNVVCENTMLEIKNLLVQVALPCILFASFAKATLEVRYIILFLIMFGFCSVCFGAGFLLKNRLPKLFSSPFTPWFLSSFEFGLVGIGLFTAIWGEEHLPVIMLVGLGHEFFAWFVCIPYAEYVNGGGVNLLETLKKFLRTPIIIGIFSGIIANLTGLYGFLQEVFWGKSVLAAMEMISTLGVPLILMFVGYSMVFHKMNMKRTVAFVGMRLVLVVGLGACALWLMDTAMCGEIDPMFHLAFYAFIALPPSYLIPVMTKELEERNYFSQVLVGYTFLSLAAYCGLLFL